VGLRARIKERKKKDAGRNPTQEKATTTVAEARIFISQTNTKRREGESPKTKKKNQKRKTQNTKDKERGKKRVGTTKDGRCSTMRKKKETSYVCKDDREQKRKNPCDRSARNRKQLRNSEGGGKAYYGLEQTPSLG